MDALGRVFSHPNGRAVMDTPSASTRALARRLLAVEAARPSRTGAAEPEAVRACEKLRLALTRLAGVDGFAALLRRALALACLEVPALRTVTLKPEGALEGFEIVAADAAHGGPEAAAALIAHLLGLLMILIGDRLTVHVVAEIWPDALLDE